MIVLDIEQEVIEETSVGVLGHVRNTKDERVSNIMFNLSLNKDHCWELNIRTIHDTWRLSYSFPKILTVDDYLNRKVIKWILEHYEIIRTLNGI